MAYAMTKQGSLDNCVTYEFICDTIADMNAIENRYRTIGSVAVVLEGESGGMEAYITGSNKQWNNLGSMGINGSESSTNSLSIYICAQNEVSNGKPNIASPDETTIYLVSAGNESGNLYEEYIYVNSAWEKFGAASIDISGKADKTDTVLETTLSRGRKANTTVGAGSFAFGDIVEASGNTSHAEGKLTVAAGTYSHAEGQGGTYTLNGITYTAEAKGMTDHVEGFQCLTADGMPGNHAEGHQTRATGGGAHSEGEQTVASGFVSHAEGSQSVASAMYTHAEGKETKATNEAAHAEGKGTTASAAEAHAEGISTVASGVASHAEGDRTTASGMASHTEGQFTIASTNFTHAEGLGGTFTLNNVEYTSGAKGTADHVEGFQCLTASGQPGNHAEGYQTRATGGAAHTEGSVTVASGNSSHAEGSTTIASGSQSHAEGYKTTASETYCHAEGNGTSATGPTAHAEGYYTTASGNVSHAEGNLVTASGHVSHAEGDSTVAVGNVSHAEGWGTKSTADYSHVSGTYNSIDSYANWNEWVANTSYEVGDKVKRTTTVNNVESSIGYICKTANNDSTFNTSKWTSTGKMNYAEIIGNGTADNARSNARTLDWDGNERLKGDLYVGCNTDSTGGNKVATESYVNVRIPTPPIANGDYLLKLNINNGTATYSWIKYTTQANIPASSVTLENGDTLTDESGNYLTYDT